MEQKQAILAGNSLERFSTKVSQWAGSTPAFGIALGFVLAWALTGPIFKFSQGWQMVINTGTTIATFLMVFLIQRAQNKESRALQLKLNEVVASQQGASNRLVGAEELSEEDLRLLHERYLRLVERVNDERTGPGLKDATSVEETTAAHQAHEAAHQAHEAAHQAHEAAHQAHESAHQAHDSEAEKYRR